MTSAAPPAPPTAPPPEPPAAEGAGGSVRSLYSGRGAVVTSIITTVLAFIAGGLVVLATGSNPLEVYKGIWDGTGLNWFFPWVTGVDRELAAFNLQQTLLLSTALVLTGLAVAFAFRCGLFNIGGQGQYIVGAVMATWVGSSWAGLAGPAHIVITIVICVVAGALWAGIAGILKAAVGVHEVITTIMLNWIAIWVGLYLFSLGGPLQNDIVGQESVPISNDVVDSVKLPVFWGDADLQGLHIGFFIAISCLVIYWLTLSRTTLGFKVRAVGRNPEAARYGGIGVGYSYFMAMAVSGAFAGLAGAMDILGWQFRLGTLDIRFSTIGFVGIAVALLGRNTPIGVGLAALLFGALFYGTSSRSLDPTVFDPQLAGNLALIIQAMVLLFIGADVFVLWLWKSRKLPKLKRPRLWGAHSVATFEGERRRSPVARLSTDGLGRRTWARTVAAVPRGMRALAIVAGFLGVFAAFVAVPPISTRDAWIPAVIGGAAVAAGLVAALRGAGRAGWTAVALGVLGGVLGALATTRPESSLDEVFVWGALVAATLRFATPLVFASLGGMFSERSGVVNIGLEGMMLTGAFFAILVADKTGSWQMGVLGALVSGAVMALIHAIVSIHLRADQIVSGTAVNFLALGLTGYLFIDIYGDEGTPSGIAQIPSVHLSFLDGVPFFGDAFGDLNLMIWLSFVALFVVYVVLFKTPFGLRLRSCGEHPRAADTVGLSVYGIRYTAVVISGMLAALGGAFLSIGFVHSFSENMTDGRGFIALAALIFGNWRPKGAFLAALLFGFSSALATRLPSEDATTVLFQALPYALTLIAVAGLVRRPTPPAAIGIPYVKQ